MVPALGSAVRPRLAVLARLVVGLAPIRLVDDLAVFVYPGDVAEVLQTAGKAAARADVVCLTGRPEYAHDCDVVVFVDGLELVGVELRDDALVARERSKSAARCR